MRSAGIQQFSKKISRVGDPWMPSLRSGVPSEKPGALRVRVYRGVEYNAGDLLAECAVDPSFTEMTLSSTGVTNGVLADLTPREEQVLRKRFGIAEKSDHTLEEVGKLFNVTRERIRQIEAKALRKLRHPVRSQPLCSYYEN